MKPSRRWGKCFESSKSPRHWSSAVWRLPSRSAERPTPPKGCRVTASERRSFVRTPSHPPRFETEACWFVISGGDRSRAVRSARPALRAWGREGQAGRPDQRGPQGLLGPPDRKGLPEELPEAVLPVPLGHRDQPVPPVPPVPQGPPAREVLQVRPGPLVRSFEPRGSPSCRRRVTAPSWPAQPERERWVAAYSSTERPRPAMRSRGTPRSRHEEASVWLRTARAPKAGSGWRGTPAIAGARSTSTPSARRSSPAGVVSG